MFKKVTDPSDQCHDPELDTDLGISTEVSDIGGIGY
jgi:hypothetical protein